MTSTCKTPPPTPELRSTPPPTTSSESEMPPSYLTPSFVESALRSKYPDISVSELLMIPAVGDGENHICKVFRARVTTSTPQILSLIIKCLPENNTPQSEFVNENNLTVREMNFYNIILPMLKDNCYTNSTPNTPQCFFTMKLDTADVIIMEDMEANGYRTANRRIGLNKEHCEVALKELAKLHALSIKLKIKNPQLFQNDLIKNYTENIYVAKNRDVFKEFLKKTFLNLAKYIKDTYPFRYECIANIFEKFSIHAFDQMYNMLQSDQLFDDHVLVLNHGDFWSNNILFQYATDNTNPLKCSIIDFQLVKWTTPVFDLLFMFFTSTCKNVRDQYFDELLQLYLDQVYLTLKNENISMPLPNNVFYTCLNELKDDMKKNTLPAFVKSIVVMPIVIAKSAPEGLMEEENALDSFLKMYSNPLFEQRLREILDDFDDMGLFRDMQQFLNQLDCT